MAIGDNEVHVKACEWTVSRRANSVSWREKPTVFKPTMLDRERKLRKGTEIRL